MTDEQIKHMAERFLSWRLPEHFNPDGGISVKRPNYAPNVQWHLTGTNLFDYEQAKAMVQHMIEGLTIETEDVARLVERLLKASAYVGDHKGLMLEDDQYDALAADLKLSASELQSLSERIAVLEGVLRLWLEYDDQDEADFAQAGPMLLYARALDATRSSLTKEGSSATE